MEVPRHKHQTQPLYTAPRFDRVSPHNRRSNTDSYHDNKSLQNQRQSNKSLRRHSTNAYSSASNSSASHKELSPTSSIQQSQLQQQMNNNSSRYLDEHFTYDLFGRNAAQYPRVHNFLIFLFQFHFGR